MELIDKQMTIIRNGITLNKVNNTYFEINNTIENSNVLLDKLMSFDFINIMNKINTDIYTEIEYNIIDVDNIHIILKLAHFFKDLGLPQQFLNLKIRKDSKDNTHTFYISNFSVDKPKCISNEIEQIVIEGMSIILETINPHKMNLKSVIRLNNTSPSPEFLDKLIGNLICKVFIRLKQFIEKVDI